MSELTDEECHELECGASEESIRILGCKALRIIDAQAAALERIRAHVRNSGGSCEGQMILRLASTEPSKPEAT